MCVFRGMVVGYSSAVSQHLGTKAVLHPGGPRLDAAQPLAWGDWETVQGGWILSWCRLLCPCTCWVNVWEGKKATSDGPLCIFNHPLQCLLLCHSAAAVPHRDAGSQCVLHNTPVAGTEGVGVQPHCLGLPQEIQQSMMLCSRQVRVLLRCIPRYLKLETP